MAMRALASATISFGLVSIPIKLFSAAEYPSTDKIAAFYRTSKFVVGMLRLEHGDEAFRNFLFSVVLEGENAVENLYRLFPYDDSAGFQEAFNDFAGLK